MTYLLASSTLVRFSLVNVMDQSQIYRVHRSKAANTHVTSRTVRHTMYMQILRVINIISTPFLNIRNIFTWDIIWIWRVIPKALCKKMWYLQRRWFILSNQALAYFPESQKFNKESNLHIHELFQELVFIHIHISEHYAFESHGISVHHSWPTQP
jgi:hypothetical protein